MLGSFLVKVVLRFLAENGNLLKGLRIFVENFWVKLMSLFANCQSLTVHCTAYSWCVILMLKYFSIIFVQIELPTPKLIHSKEFLLIFTDHLVRVILLAWTSAFWSWSGLFVLIYRVCSNFVLIYPGVRLFWFSFGLSLRLFRFVCFINVLASRGRRW